jgi:hypothetical protein
VQNDGFCCDMRAMTKTERERYEALRRKLEDAVEQTIESESGYAFRWRRDAVALAELAEFVEKESKCCPFLDFEVVVERKGGPVLLKMTGADGVKTFLRMEFGVDSRPSGESILLKEGKG